MEKFEAYKGFETKNQNENTVGNTISETNFKVNWILESNINNEKESIKLSSREQLSDIGENSHLTLEQELWKEFWLNKSQLKQIEADFRKPLTVADVLDEWESYWENLSFRDAVNEELYWIAA